MSKYPQFTLSYNIRTTNEERLGMLDLYRRAFHATKIAEGTPPGSDELHIMMEIYGVEMLLGPGVAVGKGLDNAIVCEVRYDDEKEFREAYEVLAQKAQSSALEGPYPWATSLALIMDQYGVGWALYYNEPEK